jgi:hypothetical protein
LPYTGNIRYTSPLGKKNFLVGKIFFPVDNATRSAALATDAKPRRKKAAVATQAEAPPGEGPGLLESGIRRIAWVPPGDLVPNPDNARRHGPDQMAALAELVARNGWVKPLIVNEMTGLLVDGHARRELALLRGDETVPVAYGWWTAEQEAELLAFLDANGAQATVDQARWKSLAERLASSGNPLAEAAPSLARLRGALDSDPFFRRGVGGAATLTGQAPAPAAPPAPLDADPDPAASPAAAPPAPAAPFQAPPSQVRMVQLFLSAATLPDFQARVATLQARYGLDNPTDTVMEALRREADRAG